MPHLRVERVLRRRRQHRSFENADNRAATQSLQDLVAMSGVWRNSSDRNRILCHTRTLWQKGGANIARETGVFNISRQN